MCTLSNNLTHYTGPHPHPQDWQRHQSIQIHLRNHLVRTIPSPSTPLPFFAERQVAGMKQIGTLAYETTSLTLQRSSNSKKERQCQLQSQRTHCPKVKA